MPRRGPLLQTINYEFLGEGLLELTDLAANLSEQFRGAIAHRFLFGMFSRLSKIRVLEPRSQKWVREAQKDLGEMSGRSDGDDGDVDDGVGKGFDVGGVAWRAFISLSLSLLSLSRFSLFDSGVKTQNQRMMT